MFLLNQNWFKRQDAKHKYLIKRLKLGQQYKILNTRLQSEIRDEEPTALGNLGGIANLLRGLDKDQIGELADRFLGSDEPAGSPDVGNTLLDFANQNPEIVQGLLEGITKRKKQEVESSPDGVTYLS